MRQAGKYCFIPYFKTLDYLRKKYTLNQFKKIPRKRTRIPFYANIHARNTSTSYDTQLITLMRKSLDVVLSQASSIFRIKTL